MKKALFAAVLAVLWSAPVRADDTHESLADDAVKAFSTFGDILAKITDKPSAESAKPKLKETGAKLADLKIRFDKIGEPKGEKKDELDKKYKPKMEEAAKKVQNEMIRIATKIEGGMDIIKDITEALSPLNKKTEEKKEEKK